MWCHLQEDTEGYKTTENSNLEHLEKEDGSFQAMRGQQTLLAIKKLRLGDGEMAQWVNRLLNKHEDLSFIFRTHVKKIKKMW